MSDRVLVMREGRLVAEFSRAEATQERVISGRRRRGGGGVISRRPRKASKPHELAAAAFRLREIGIVIALVGVVIFFGARATNFLTVANWQDIAQNVSIVLVVAVGETMVILTRNIDLSVGSIVGLSGYLVAATLKHYHGIPVEVVALIGIAIGLGLRHRQRPARRGRPHSGNHRHAGNARDLSRHRLPSSPAARTSPPISCPIAFSARGSKPAGVPALPGLRSESRSWVQRRFAGLRGRETSMRSARTPTLLASPAFRRAGA